MDRASMLVVGRGVGCKGNGGGLLHSSVFGVMYKKGKLRLR